MCLAKLLQYFMTLLSVSLYLDVSTLGVTDCAGSVQLKQHVQQADSYFEQ